MGTSGQDARTIIGIIPNMTIAVSPPRALRLAWRDGDLGRYNPSGGQILAFDNQSGVACVAPAGFILGHHAVISTSGVPLIVTVIIPDQRNQRRQTTENHWQRVACKADVNSNPLTLSLARDNDTLVNASGLLRDRLRNNRPDHQGKMCPLSTGNSGTPSGSAIQSPGNLFDQLFRTYRGIGVTDAPELFRITEIARGDGISRSPE
jgi:hypothetical protein